MNNDYYVYLYRHPVTKTPFYVGMGRGSRYLDHMREARRALNPKNSHKLNTIRKLLKEDKHPEILFLDTSLSIDEAYDLETFMIEWLGRRDLSTGTLTNLTNGGEGRT